MTINIRFLFITLFFLLQTDNLLADNGCREKIVAAKQAPENLYTAKNPRQSNKDIIAGKKIYLETGRPLPCKECHGKDGKGFLPFLAACENSPFTITAGQMFWRMKNSVAVTGMPEHKKLLSDDEIWQVIAYIKKEVVKD